MTFLAKGIPPFCNHLMWQQFSSRQYVSAEDHQPCCRFCDWDAVFLMACFTSDPCVGVVNDLFIVWRMALTTIDSRQRFMVLLNRLSVTFQALNVLVDRRRIVIRHFFMALRALGIGVAVTCIGLCCSHR